MSWPEPPGPLPSPAPRPPFLARASYRRRRLAEAARLAPLAGAALWSVPLLWPRGETATSSALLYVFGVWALLILLSALLARALRRPPPEA
ncbi:hypothetical protein [Pseudoroseicyclus aestuarii]|uniref:Uncharacterized protein n=1 Tax=Pseudoroseicyclus aestuarii TaxID=1795041 RepID=A0A318TBP7_9RHOB|nr:hypothetical protein [Pseudoroseicyclus aestuarii]PYE85758.1 hypothetical protein DFP88_101430 [Pseudoroseicyclus aestuarii]